jgi:hypothetical protein
MKIVKVYGTKSCLNPWKPTLNIRQLFNSIFFEREQRHHDMKSQRSRRRRSLDLHQARALKAAYVPLCLVDRTIYLERFNGVTGSFDCTRLEI